MAARTRTRAVKNNSAAAATAIAEQPVHRRRSAGNAVKPDPDENETKSSSVSTVAAAAAKTSSTAKRARATPPVSRRTKKIKVEEAADDPILAQKTEGGVNVKSEDDFKTEDKSDASDSPKKRARNTDGNKSAAAISSPSPSPSPRKRNTSKDTKAKEADLQAKKLKSYGQFATSSTKQSPYPDFPRPTPSECVRAHEILAAVHGDRVQPAQTDLKAPANRAGCGDSPSVLDALVRTILSQNTSDKNSTRAKLSMDKTYGGHDNWAAIASGGQPKLEAAIQSGGLANTKSKVILSILEQVREKYGAYSLDHLFAVPDDEAMREMLSFKGVGPKTASCVLLFCLRRASFAVDTHVHRIAGLLGWRPAAATRDLTHAHLDARIPDELKYALHVLFVRHGKECAECRAGGKSAGKCALRKAFKRGVLVEGGEGDEKGLKTEEAEEDDADEKGLKDEDEDEETKFETEDGEEKESKGSIKIEK